MYNLALLSNDQHLPIFLSLRVIDHWRQLFYMIVKLAKTVTNFFIKRIKNLYSVFI